MDEFQVLIHLLRDLIGRLRIGGHVGVLQVDGDVSSRRGVVRGWNLIRIELWSRWSIVRIWIGWSLRSLHVVEGGSGFVVVVFTSR